MNIIAALIVYGLMAYAVLAAVCAYWEYTPRLYRLIKQWAHRLCL